MAQSRPVRAVAFEPRLPGDKSITHRAYLLSTLVHGSYRVTGGNPGRDCRGTLDALRALGVSVEEAGGAVQLMGAAGELTRPASSLDLGNSGTGFRLLLGILAAQTFETRLTGDTSLQRRPMGRVLEPLQRMGARTRGSTPPVTITGGPLNGITYSLPMASAQVKSALLLAGVQARGTTAVRGPVQTRDHTERLLDHLGAPVTCSPDEVRVTGPAPLRARDLHVPADPSAAAFYAALPALVPGSTAAIPGVGLNPRRTGYLSCLRQMGLEVETEVSAESPEPVGRLWVGGRLQRGLQVKAADVPGIIDELPILAAVCAVAPGVSVLSGLAELKHKESDRLEAMAHELRSLGARIEVMEDGWRIEGSAGEPLAGGKASGRGDHRVAMALLMAGLGSRDGVRLTDDSGIGTSDPYFIENLNRLQEEGAA